MNKLEMAHEYSIKMIGCPNIPVMNAEQISSAAFDLVDAMIAEHHKRNYQEDQDGSEWQPDWSQAPEGYDWFIVGGCSGKGFFCLIKPSIVKDHYWFVGEDCLSIDKHNYQGDWRDSLRKRPK